MLFQQKIADFNSQKASAVEVSNEAWPIVPPFRDKKHRRPPEFVAFRDDFLQPQWRISNARFPKIPHLLFCLV